MMGDRARKEKNTKESDSVIIMTLFSVARDTLRAQEESANDKKARFKVAINFIVVNY